MKARLHTGLFLCTMNCYFTIYKPFNVLSQFTSIDGKKSLADFFKVPKNVYPAGRLDYDSEGLLILTNDTKLNHRLLNPAFKHTRTYWVQVEGAITVDAIERLQKGLPISINGKQYQTLPGKASILPVTPLLPERNPPIRFRKNIPTSWISLELTEGKNRQVRRMTAKAGYPTLRLVRQRIERISLGSLQPGEMKEWTQQEMFKALFG